MVTEKLINAGKVLELASGYWASCALHASIRCGVLPRLAQGSTTSEELTRELDLDSRGLRILLGALEAMGFLVEEKGSLALAPGVGRFFTQGAPSDMTNLVNHMADMVSVWANLSESVRTGKPVKRKDVNEGDSPERRHFYLAMRDLARKQAPGLAGRLGLRPGMRVLDLAGGPGVYGLTFADEVPGLMVSVFDLPQALPFFQREREGRPGRNQVCFQGGDYHGDLPEGPFDLIWLSQVLHGEGPVEAGRLIAKAVRSLKPGGALWVQEFLKDSGGESGVFSALFSLNMLVNTQNGQSYGTDEVTGFMTRAGLVNVRPMGWTAEKGPASLIRGDKPLEA